MAKIPRIDKGSLPSAVPQASVGDVDQSAEVFARVSEGLVGLSRVASQSEKRMAAALAQKQRVKNELEVGRLMRSFEEADRALVDQLQTEFHENPDAAIEPYKQLLTKQLDAIVESSPNDEVALKAARALNSKVEAKIGKMYQWSVLRDTQIIGAQVEDTLSQAAAGAENLATASELDDYVGGVVAEQQAGIAAVHGDKADARVREFYIEAVKSYGNLAARKRPRQLLDELDDAEGPFGALSSSERKTLRSAARSGLKGILETRRHEMLRSAEGQSREAVDSFMAGDLDVSQIFQMKRAVREKKSAVEIDPDYDEKARAEAIETFGKEMKVLDALGAMVYEQTPLNTIDDTTEIRRILDRQRELLTKKGKKRSGTTLKQLLDHALDLATLGKSRKITPGTARTLLGEINSVILEERDEALHGGLTWWPFGDNTAWEFGQSQIGREFERRPNIPTETRNVIELTFKRNILTLAENGTEITPEIAQAEATKAFNTHVGRRFGGRQR